MTKDTKNANEGEGSKTAAKQYDDGATKHAQGGNVGKAAQSARDALEGTEGKELQRAEDEGKRHMAEEDPNLRDPNRTPKE